MLETKRNKRTILKTMIMLLLVAILIPGISSEAASAKTQAKKAYQNYLKTNAGAIEKFGTAYMNNDNIPELIFEYDYTTYIYTYKNGEWNKWFEGPSYNVYSYYKKKGVLQQFYAHRGFYTTEYMKLSKGQFVRKLRMEKFAYGGKAYFKCSKYDSDKIGKTTFRKKLKSYVGSQKAVSIKMRKNTKKNRAKYL